MRLYFVLTLICSCGISRCSVPVAAATAQHNSSGSNLGTSTGTITGTVVDPSGAAIAGVTVISAVEQHFPPTITASFASTADANRCSTATFR